MMSNNNCGLHVIVMVTDRARRLQSECNWWHVLYDVIGCIGSSDGQVVKVIVIEL